MENENKEGFIKEQSGWLIPILCLLVVFQALAIFSQFKTPKTNSQIPFIPAPLIQEVSDSSAVFSFVPGGISLKKGQSATVDLVFTPKKAMNLDGMDIVISYNPSVIQISQLNTPKLFSFVSQNKEKEKEGKLVATFLEEKQGGLLVSSETKVLSLVVKGKEVGTGDMSLVTAEEGASTIITESGTSKKILFNYGSLKLVVY